MDRCPVSKQTATSVSDIYRRSLVPDRDDTHYFRMSRWFSVGWGAVGARWRRPLPWLVIPLLGAILLHVLWDIVAFDAMVRVNRQLPGLWINATLSILLMLSGLIAFRLLVRHAASHPPRGNPKPSNPSVAP